MGHFSVSCSYSGLDIPHGPCVLVPLIPTIQYSEQNSFFEAIPVSNDGAYIWFSLASLPIYGDYNEYGELENIEKNELTEAIEKYFEMPIEEFVSSLIEGNIKVKVKRSKIVKADGSNFKKGERVSSEDYKFIDIIEEETLTACWYHRTIYDKMSTYQTRYGGKNEKTSEIVDLTEECLLALGFKYIETDETQERFNKHYHFPSVPAIKLWSDGTWVKAENLKGSLYSPRDLAVALKKDYDYDLDLTPIDGKTATEVKYDEALVKFMAEDDMIELFKERLTDEKLSEEDKEKIKDRIVTMRLRMLIDAFRSLPLSPSHSDRFNPYVKLYPELLAAKSDFLRQEVCKWVSFYWTCYMNNRPIMPTPSGMQDGEYSCKAFAAGAKMSVILKKELDYYERYPEEIEEGKKSDLEKLMDTFNSNLPSGFKLIRE